MKWCPNPEPFSFPVIFGALISHFVATWIIIVRHSQTEMGWHRSSWCECRTHLRNNTHVFGCGFVSCRTQSFREIDWNIICNLMCHMNYGFMINAIKYHYLMRRNRARSFICPVWETLRWHLNIECLWWPMYALCMCVSAWHCGTCQNK